MFVWLFFCAIFYFFLVYPIVHFNAGYISLFKKNKWLCFSLVILFIFVGEVIYFLLSHEHFVYYWDYGGYYSSTLEVMQKYADYHLGLFKFVYSTSVYSDYGMFIPSLLAFPLSFTQGRYVDYIVLLYVMFGIPFSVSFSGLLCKITKAEKPFTFFLCNFLSLIIPGTFFAMLQGYPGIAAYIPILCSLWILFVNGMKNLKIQDAVILSFSLIFSFVLRRYFSFDVLAFVGASIFFSLYNLFFVEKIKANEIIRKGLIPYFKSYILVGGISIAVLLIGLWGLIKRIFFTNYAAMYVAYNHGTLFEKYRNLFYRFGSPVFLFFIIACIYIFFKKRAYISYIVFCIAFEIIATLSFFHTQAPSPQHYWVFYIPLLIVCLIPILELLKERKVINTVFSSIFVFVICVNSIYVYTGSFKQNWRNPFLKSDRYYLKNRGDIATLKELCSYVENISAGKKVYITASGGVLNSDVIRKFYLPKLSAPFDIAWVCDVDQRDGFSTDFFESEIIVTTEKNETHLGEQNQRCITVLNENVQNPESIIGENFNKEKSFTLDAGIIATVYVRKNYWSKDAVDYLEKIYDGYYPTMPEFFHDRFENYKSARFLNDDIDSVFENAGDIN